MNLILIEAESSRLVNVTMRLLIQTRNPPHLKTTQLPQWRDWARQWD